MNHKCDPSLILIWPITLDREQTKKATFRWPFDSSFQAIAMIFKLS